MRTNFVACVAIISTVLSAHQHVATRTLSKPDVELPEGFTQVDAVRELEDGRLVVLDKREWLLRLVDLARGSVTQLGRSGSGPGEYVRPDRLMPLSARKLAVYDAGNERLLSINAHGEIGSIVNLLGAGAGANPATGARLVVPEASDTADGVYHLLGGVRSQPNGTLSQSDSSAIERLDLNTRRRDTVAFMRDPALGFQPVPGSRGHAVRPRSEIPGFGSSDQWIVAPDGRVAVMSVDPYRVTYFERGRRLDGPVIAYERVRVTEEDKKQWLAELSSPTEAVIVPEGSKRATRAMTRSPSAGRPVRWPTDFPPFLHDALLFAPDGQLWIRRARSVDDPPMYDVLARDGRLVERVILPQHCHVVGFGPRSIYVVRVDDDGLQYLRRYTF